MRAANSQYQPRDIRSDRILENGVECPTMSCCHYALLITCMSNTHVSVAMVGFFLCAFGAERWASGAAGSGSDAGADAGSRHLHAVVIQWLLTPYEVPGAAMATGDAPPVSPTLLAVG